MRTPERRAALARLRAVLAERDNANTPESSRLARLIAHMDNEDGWGRIAAARQAGRDHEADVAVDTLLEFQAAMATIDQVEEALADCDHGMIPRHADLGERVKVAVEAADQAFWAVIARHFPEAKSGDFPPMQAISRDNANNDDVIDWLEANRVLSDG